MNPQGGFRLRVDEIRHRLRLDEVDPPAEEGAQGELPRIGEPGAQEQAAVQNSGGGGAAAVALDFEYVFTGIGVGTGHPEEENFVEGAAVSWVDGASQGGAARLGSSDPPAVGTPQEIFQEGE
jgi:hypothetical protein